MNDTSALTDIDNLLNEILEAGQEDVLVDDIEVSAGKQKNIVYSVLGP